MLYILIINHYSMNTLIKQGFFNALGTFAYIALLVLAISHGSKLFGGEEQTILLPMAFLMLFVLSAAITGGLVIGKPILMYINGKKNEAVRLFFYTLGWLVVGIVIVLSLSLTQ